MIAFADILAKASRSSPEDGWIKLVFFGVFALIWIISGVASALAKKKGKLPRVPQPWQPSPPSLPVPQKTASPVEQRRPRQENRPRLKAQIRTQPRGPAMSPSLPRPQARHSPDEQRLARERLISMGREPIRGPVMPPPLPQTRMELPPVQEVVASINNTVALRGTTGPAPMTRVRRLVGQDLRRAVLMAEVLGTPVSLRQGSIGSVSQSAHTLGEDGQEFLPMPPQKARQK
ncbi:MAG: hypothetical protein ACHRHE_06410 [Tepidisphaerales bacterium]